MFKGISWVGVVLSLVTTQILGILWYGPWFGEAWMQLQGRSLSEPPPANLAWLMAMGTLMNLLWILGVAGSLKLHYNSPLVDRISKLIPALGSLPFYRRAATGKVNALLIWMTIVVPVQSMQFTYAGHPLGLIPIDLGYTFVAFPLVGAIVGFFSRLPQLQQDA
jgi:hypothetical protein